MNWVVSCVSKEREKSKDRRAKREEQREKSKERRAKREEQREKSKETRKVGE